MPKGLDINPPPLPKQTETQSKWLSAAGYKDGKMPKDFTEFAHKLSYEQQTALLKEAGGNWGDADTIGALTGGLAGAMYGYKDIPQRWVQKLDPEIKKYLEKFVDFCCQK